MDQSPKQQVVERIKSSTNILVTVSNDPSVDQLAACIGFTLLLNKLGKHATAVFSGTVPSTLEFLQPEKTLETTTDSLQDFIIALDKSKADKLRYKVEDDVVRIFITPYRTSITEKDLEFSLGDFNVDVVVALGVTKKEEIDQAIVAHGRILHDAVVMTVTDGEELSDVGSINWNEPGASSLSEMLVSISESFQSGLLDPQMSTSFLTGIVAETDRFSNEKTTPKVMTMSAQLMAAGANQQLIATKLTPPPPEPPAPVEEPYEPPAEEPTPEAPVEPVEPPEVPPQQKHDGEIDIPHEHEAIGVGLGSAPVEEEEVEEDEIHIDDEGNLKQQAELQALEQAKLEAAAREAEERATSTEVRQDSSHPAVDNGFLANNRRIVDPLPGQADFDPLLPAPAEPALNLPPVQVEPPAAPEPPAPAEARAPDPLLFDPMSTPPVLPSPEPPIPPVDTMANETLAQLERDVDSPHLAMVDTPDTIDEARQAVATAGLDVPPRPEASHSLGAQNLDLGAPAAPVMTGVADILQATGSGDPIVPVVPDLPTAPASPAPVADDPLSPPPVPPPMTMPYFEPKTSHHNPYLNPSEKPAPDKPGDAPV